MAMAVGEQKLDVAEFRAIALDDDASVLRALGRILARNGFDVVSHEEPIKGLEAIAQDAELDLVILDVEMPLMSGFDVLARLRESAPHLPVVMLTGDATSETAVRALRAGAFNYLTKEHLNDPQAVAQLMRQAASIGKLQRHTKSIEHKVALADRFENLIGASIAMRQLYSVIERIAPLDVGVLILGESGTGKELVARAIHEHSTRTSKSFVALNCGAIPSTLVDAELFGHTRGSFTGAFSDRAGAFERAHGGTLLLDEIGDVPAEVQIRLLRVLQEREIRRVGGNAPIDVNVRVIAATLVDLEAAVEAREFREDLYYRLNVVSVEVPPLRHRLDDIPLLAAHFLRKHAHRMGREIPRLRPEVIDLFSAYHWPGNVRELENAIQRVLALSTDDEIGTDSLPPRIAAARPQAPIASGGDAAGNDSLEWTQGMPLSEARRLVQDRFERGYLERIMRKTGGNISRAAREAGVDRSNLRRLMARHGIKAADFTKGR